jgi:hypothetical protein
MKFRNLFEVKKLRSARSAYQFDMELGFWGVPGFNERVETGIGEKKINVSLNSDGDREKEITEIDKNGSIVVIGGSHTWGVGIEDGRRYSDILAKKINKQVINMGKASFGIDQICMVITNKMIKYNPRIVIIEQYPWAILRILNHYMGRYVKPYFKLDSNGELQLVKVPKIAKFRYMRILSGAFLSYIKELKEFRSGISIKDNYDPMNDPIFQSWKLAHYDYMYKLFREILLTTKSYCDEKNIKLLFVLGTIHQQFVGVEKSELIDYDLPKTKIKDILDDLNIDYVDTKDELLKNHSIEDPVIFDDGHINSKGNNIFASVILKKLKKLSWL